MGSQHIGFVACATIISPPLTTIHQPCRDIAAIAFDARLTRISDPDKPLRTLLLTPHLVVRESCGAYLSNPGQASVVSLK